MLVHAKKIVVLSVITLVAAVISLPVVSLAATAPAVAVLNPLTLGLRAPVKLALDAAGSSYVADQRVGGIVKLNANGVPQATIRTAVAPVGLAFAQDGALLVCQGAYVARYSVATGEELGRFGEGQLQASIGIAVDDVTGFVYVSDGKAGQVAVFTASGSFVKSFGAGRLKSSTGIAFERVARQLVVADTLGRKLQVFDVDGNFVKVVGAEVSPSYGATLGPMQFNAPAAVAFEYNKSGQLDRMYVVDAFRGNVQVVDPAGSGSFLSYIGTAGTSNGQLMVPSDAVFDAVNNRLLVVNGYGNVTVYGIDGGVSPSDVTPPSFSVNPLPAEVTANAVTISGSLEVGSTIQVTATGSAQVGAAVYSGSTWGVTVSTLSSGVNSFTVTAKDAAGNAAVPQVVSTTYLLPAPALTVASIVSATKTPLLTVTGTVEAGASVVVSNAASSVSGAAVVSGATWSYTGVLVEGVNSLTVTAQFPQGAKAVVTSSVVLDTVAPVLSVSALASGSVTSTQVQNISGAVADANSVSVTVNGVPAALSGNSFSVPVSLVGGANQVLVVAVDAAGNAASDARVITFDVTKPVIAIQEPVDNSFTANAEQVISGTVDKDSTVVTVAGVPASVQNKVWSAAVNLAAGINTIEVVATDLAGNSSSAKRTITLDTVKPVLAVVSPVQDIAVKVPNVVIAGSLSDSTALSLEYAVNGAAPKTVPVVAGAYSFNVDFAAEGNYSVAITAKDAAGNSSTAVRNVIYDITPPVLTLNQVSGVMPEKLAGTVEAGSSVVVKDGAAVIGSASVANGLWTANLAGVTYSPESLLVVATDAAGNSTSKSLTYNFPDGTLNAGGKPTIQDALRAIRIVVNQLTPTSAELAHYDVGPLVNGKPNPNGKVELVDAILILRKALGLKSW